MVPALADWRLRQITWPEIYQHRKFIVAVSLPEVAGTHAMIRYRP